jgi:hypothetical protein
MPGGSAVVRPRRPRPEEERGLPDPVAEVHDAAAEPSFVERLEPHLDAVGSARAPPPTEIGLTNGSISSTPGEGCERRGDQLGHDASLS